MRPIVAARFLDFTRPLEGLVEHMYVDVKGLVTIGFGNLIDPISYALALPFVKKVGGARATPAEITAEWNLIKDADNKLQLKTKGYTACAPLTALKLTQEAILDLCGQRLRANEWELKKIREFQKLDEWPADAQLALHSMAWAMGPAFAAGGQWPRFRAACGKMDFMAAADNCRIGEAGNPGVVPRNLANKRLFWNAYLVLTGAAVWYSRDILYYPLQLMYEPPPDLYWDGPGERKRPIMPF
jgi:GH24 family phage-related lysozyme (muramidase)